MTFAPRKFKVIQNLYPADYQGSEKGNIYMVASGKGGVGKTWFSITIAHALAQLGKKVLLFDGDLGLANIDIQLGLAPAKDLGSVIAGQCTLSEAVICHPQGQFHMVAGRSGCGSLSSLTPQRLTLLGEEIKFLAPQYDIVLVDLGAGVGGTVRSLSDVASGYIVITTEEPTSLTDAYAFIKLTHQSSPLLPLNIIINQADSIPAGMRTFEILEKVCSNFLNLKPHYLGSIRRDKRVREAIRHQTLLLMRHPLGEASQDIGIIARELEKKCRKVRQNGSK